MPRLTLAAVTLLVLLALVGVALLGFHAEDYATGLYPAGDNPRNWLGYPGALAAGALLPTLGYGTALLLALGVTLAVLLLRRSPWLSGLGRLAGWLLLVPGACLVAGW